MPQLLHPHTPRRTKLLTGILILSKFWVYILVLLAELQSPDTQRLAASRPPANNTTDALRCMCQNTERMRDGTAVTLKCNPKTNELRRATQKANIATQEVLGQLMNLQDANNKQAWDL